MESRFTVVCVKALQSDAVKQACFVESPDNNTSGLPKCTVLPFVCLFFLVLMKTLTWVFIIRRIVMTAVIRLYLDFVDSSN